MPVTTFEVNPQMQKTLEKLRKHFGASSQAEILRRAIAFLEVARETEAKGGEVVVRDKDKHEAKVLLR